MPGDTVFHAPGTVVLKVWFAAAPGNLLEMQILGPHPKPTESETLTVGPSNLQLTNPPCDSDA